MVLSATEAVASHSSLFVTNADRLHAELSSRGLQLALVTVAEYGMKQLFVPEPDGYSICFESPIETWVG
jgi:hypothetical protein